MTRRLRRSLCPLPSALSPLPSPLRHLPSALRPALHDFCCSSVSSQPTFGPAFTTHLHPQVRVTTTIPGSPSPTSSFPPLQTFDLTITLTHAAPSPSSRPLPPRIPRPTLVLYSIPSCFSDCPKSHGLQHPHPPPPSALVLETEHTAVHSSRTLACPTTIIEISTFAHVRTVESVLPRPALGIHHTPRSRRCAPKPCVSQPRLPTLLPSSSSHLPSHIYIRLHTRMH